MYGRIGVSILADDGDRRMSPGRCFRELNIHVGNVAHIREHPDLGLACLALDDRLKLAVYGELQIPFVVWEGWVRRQIVLRFAVGRGEALQIARNELQEPAHVAD
jgi:hypothetical protein